MAFRATVLTLYPEMFPGPLGVSLAGRALEEGVWSIETVQIRDFASDKHRTVDDTPAGGGAGMVLKPDVLAAAIDHARALHPDCKVLAMTPRGAPITQGRIRELATGRLVQPFETLYLPGSALWLVHPAGRVGVRKIERFREWIIDELTADRALVPPEVWEQQ